MTKQKQLYYTPSQTMLLAEWHVYGSSRLGIYKANKPLAKTIDETIVAIQYQTRIKYRYNGKKQYELSNHLGNVLVTISDRRKAICNEVDSTLSYSAVVLTATDYYAFGSPMVGRTYEGDTSLRYRFGFNGKEKDDETYGAGNEMDFGERVYDGRLGKFFSIDPLQFLQTSLSVYSFAGNQPIWAIDAKGLIRIIIIEIYNQADGKEIRINKGIVYDKPTAEELNGKKITEITLTIHTKTILVYDKELSNPTYSNIVTRGVTVSTSVTKTGGLSPRGEMYQQNLVCGLAGDFARVSPFGQFAQALTSTDFSTGEKLNDIQVAAKIIGGAADLISYSNSSTIMKFIVNKMSEEIEEKVIEQVTQNLGVDQQSVIKLVWSLSKLAKEVSLNEGQVQSISHNLKVALKGGKCVTEFINDLSNQFNIDLIIDYKTVDDAIKGESEKYAEPESNYIENEYGCFEEKY